MLCALADCFVQRTHLHQVQHEHLPLQLIRSFGKSDVPSEHPGEAADRSSFSNFGSEGQPNGNQGRLPAASMDSKAWMSPLALPMILCHVDIIRLCIQAAATA